MIDKKLFSFLLLLALVFISYSYFILLDLFLQEDHTIAKIAEDSRQFIYE